jgi:hypothetical protein
MWDMRRSLLVLGSTLLFGCAHTVEGAHTTTIESAPPPSEREVVVVDTPAPIEPAVEAPRARPRLSQTVTLGQGQTESIYTVTPPAPSREGGGPNVTVNNNITINQQPTYGYGYGYGGYGYGASASRGVRTDGFGSRGQTNQAWAPNGWEGARRTAPPGVTPGVGGNWAPAPSFGPAPMK